MYGISHLIGVLFRQLHPLIRVVADVEQPQVLCGCGQVLLMCRLEEKRSVSRSWDPAAVAGVPRDELPVAHA